MSLFDPGIAVSKFSFISGAADAVSETRCALRALRAEGDIGILGLTISFAFRDDTRLELTGGGWSITRSDLSDCWTNAFSRPSNRVIVLNPLKSAREVILGG